MCNFYQLVLNFAILTFQHLYKKYFLISCAILWKLNFLEPGQLELIKNLE